MSRDPDKNSVIFDVLLRAADSYEHLSKRVRKIKQEIYDSSTYATILILTHDADR